MQKPKVIVTIEDGIVMSVHTDRPADVTILNIDSDAECAEELYELYDRIQKDDALRKSKYSNGFRTIDP